MFSCRCEVCGFQCRQRASLKYHMTKHKAEADLEFACLICSKRFEKAHNLNVHMSMVHPLTQTKVQKGGNQQSPHTAISSHQNIIMSGESMPQEQGRWCQEDSQLMRYSGQRVVLQQYGVLVGSNWTDAVAQNFDNVYLPLLSFSNHVFRFLSLSDRQEAIHVVVLTKIRCICICIVFLYKKMLKWNADFLLLQCFFVRFFLGP